MSLPGIPLQLPFKPRFTRPLDARSYGTTNDRPVPPVPGLIRYEHDSQTIKYSDGSAWFDLLPPSIISPGTIVNATVDLLFLYIGDSTVRLGSYNGNVFPGLQAGDHVTVSGFTSLIYTAIPPATFNKTFTVIATLEASPGSGVHSFTVDIGSIAEITHIYNLNGVNATYGQPVVDQEGVVQYKQLRDASDQTEDKISTTYLTKAERPLSLTLPYSKNERFDYILTNYGASPSLVLFCSFATYFYPGLQVGDSVTISDVSGTYAGLTPEVLNSTFTVLTLEQESLQGFWVDVGVDASTQEIHVLDTPYPIVKYGPPILNQEGVVQYNQLQNTLTGYLQTTTASATENSDTPFSSGGAYTLQQQLNVVTKAVCFRLSSDVTLFDKPWGDNASLDYGDWTAMHDPVPLTEISGMYIFYAGLYEFTLVVTHAWAGTGPFQWRTYIHADTTDVSQVILGSNEGNLAPVAGAVATSTIHFIHQLTGQTIITVHDDPAVTSGYVKGHATEAMTTFTIRQIL